MNKLKEIKEKAADLLKGSKEHLRLEIFDGNLMKPSIETFKLPAAEAMELAAELSEANPARRVLVISKGNSILAVYCNGKQEDYDTLWFCGGACHLIADKYRSNDRLALELLDLHTAEPVLVVTVNIPDCYLEEDEVLVKNYSEGEGILKALIEAGYMEDTGKSVKTGFVTLPICRLLKEIDNVERGSG